MTCVFVTSNFIGRLVVSPALYAYSWKPDLFRQLIHTMYKVLQKKVVLAEDDMKIEKNGYLRSKNLNLQHVHRTPN